MGDNSTNVVPFNFGEQQVRTLQIAGEPWFVAADVCRVLEVGNTTQAVQALDEDERSMFNIGRQGNANLVNESGLYTLILRSRDAVKKGSKAHTFRKWVTAEVLPSIRKAGRYDDQQAKMPTLMDELIGMSELSVIKGLIRDKGKTVAADKRQSFALTMHNRLHTRFNVPRTELIPASQFESACNFIASYSLEGEWVSKESESIHFNGAPRSRYLLAYDHKGERHITQVPDDAYVLSFDDLISGLVSVPGDIPVSTDSMFKFAMAALANLQVRSQAQARRITA
ncbi:antirepressor [Pseudomonas monteilii]|nr:antirepressor [Pseudomonas monteilii]